MKTFEVSPRRGGRVTFDLTPLEAQALLFLSANVLDDREYARSLLGEGRFVQAANRAYNKMALALEEEKP